MVYCRYWLPSKDWQIYLVSNIIHTAIDISTKHNNQVAVDVLVEQEKALLMFCHLSVILSIIS